MSVDAGYAFDGQPPEALAARLGLPRVVVRDEVSSTMDVAHALAADGAPAGTLVLAERQTAGRGRAGKQWSSPAGTGLWLTLVERPRDRAGVQVLSLRVGLEVAQALDALAPSSGTDALAPSRVQLKWPNDLYAAGRKLAGVLVEARWREQRPDWVAIGVGLNVAPPPDVATATGLRAGATRLRALGLLVPAIRRACAARGALLPHERTAWEARDMARGRPCLSPIAGVVAGIAPDGALLVRLADGSVSAAHGGSLVFADEPHAPEGIT
jgi:BirA family transcriptional regulator, biotin operon repressor / biotin---[acetyl-CoA-carboxylase] ligase